VIPNITECLEKDEDNILNFIKKILKEKFCSELIIKKINSRNTPNATPMLINIIEYKGLNRSASPGILNREKKAITANPIVTRA
jgi:hypothetical protein